MPVRSERGSVPGGVGINQRTQGFVHEVDKFIYCDIVREMDEGVNNIR